MSFVPTPCPPGSAGGDPGFDVEQNLLCDIDAEGNVVGTALAVYEYDAETGAPVGAPTYVDPATGNPYVPVGVLQPCPGDTGCLAPIQFCFTSTSTGPVDHPGRQYDITLPINPGFAVQSLQVDAVNSPANIVWDVSDPDGEAFRQALTTFIEGRVPAAAVVTITNPNAGGVICGTAQPMQIHIECLRLDENPPDLIELVYNGGQDLIINPAYNETPPLNPPVSQGNYGFRLLSRQDDPGPFPGNQPANDANCTDVANRGWETNDIGRTFEIWGDDIVTGSNVTPTPRGTPVQEMTSDGPPPGGISTIWQTFQAPSSGNFIIRVVHGARDAGEIHRITLDNGDTDDAQNGDLIDDITTPAVVTNSPGGPSPWTTFNQTIPLNAGNIYTLALSTTENPPDNNARGGLFTDMRAFLDRPDQRATATTDDETCVVTVDETTTITDCQWWAPLCAGGDIQSWRNVETDQVLSNAQFWGQAPAPECCIPPTSEAGDGGSVNANLVHNYEICGIVGGVPTTLNRVVITDASGGVLAESIIGPDGAPVSPSSYTIGSCTADRYVNDEILCDDTGPFLRKYIQTLNETGQGQVESFRDFTLAGAVYTPVGTVTRCMDNFPDREGICYVLDSTGTFVHTGWARHDDTLPNTPQTPNGIAFFDNLGNFIDPTADGFTQVTCERVNPAVTPTVFHGEKILCDDNGPFLRKYVQQPDGSVDDVVDFDLGGNPYIVVGVVGICPVEVEVQPTEFEFEEQVLCDDNGPFFRRTTFNTSTQTYDPPVDFTLTGAAYVPVGSVGVCGAGVDVEFICFVDNAATRFTRVYVFTDGSGIPTSVTDMDEDGNPFVPNGAVVPCDTAIDLDSELEILCDANGDRFIRRYVWAQRGASSAPVGVNDWDFDGLPFVAVDPVAPCTTGCNSVETFQLCDIISETESNLVVVQQTYDCQGVLISTAYFTPDGDPYTPVGTIQQCRADCCPINIGQGCWDTGAANGQWTAIRNADGTITIFDPVTGLTVDPADIVDCENQTQPTNNIDSTIQRQTGAGSIVIAAGARSITLIVLNTATASATVTIGADPGVAVPPGASLTWAVDDRDELLLNAHTFTGIAGSDFIVTTTRQ